MSDAITLDVLSASPVQLDVGDADPIAREEIAALATRVTTVEGDVDGIDARVEAIEADYVTAEDVMGALGGEAPALVSGSSRAVLGDAETASWMQRTTAADGVALIESVQGNTIVQDGSLLPVRMEGVETVGFNQWDGEVEPGIISGATGLPSAMGYNEYRRAKNYVPCLPSTVYNFTSPSSNMYVVFYDVDRTPIKRTDLDSYQYLLYSGSHELTAPANARYIRFNFQANYVPNHDICINISDPARNGTYEPYWSEQRTIAAIAEKFPDGMRSAGTVRDELTETQAITRVGSVDLGTLNWEYVTFGEGHWRFYARLNDMARGLDMICANYDVVPASVQYTQGVKSISAQVAGSNYIVMIVDEAYTDAATFKAAMSGVMLHYALATPTITPIDPPLPLSYRTGAGGTERVMVASGTMSAPPIFVTRYPLDPADLAASIAPVDGPIAKTNHQVGDLIMLGFTLCKATQVIVTGETIAIGTNVTRTTVAAELAALSE